MGDQMHTTHPYADIFPMMDGAQFADLVADIKAHGLREPVILFDGAILDGRNRHRACQEAGVDCRFELFSGDDPLAFVISKNLKRRHLNESQRAMVAKRLATMKQGERTDLEHSANLPKVSQDEAATLLNVSSRAIRHAGVVQEKAAPELVAAVDRGEIAVSTAAEIVHLPKERQRDIAAAGKKEAAKAAKRVRSKRQAKREVSEMQKPEQKETQHDRDLRFLEDLWEVSCDSARAAFAKKKFGIELRAVA